VCQGARLAGAATIIAIDTVASRRDASRRVGATHTVDPAEEDPIEQVKALTGGRGADYSFEVVGRPGLIVQAFEMARQAETVTLVGMPPMDATVTFPAFGTILSGKRLCGSVMGDAQILRDFPCFIKLAEVGKLDLGSLVSRRINLDEVNDGRSWLNRAEGVRIVIV
jgi:S-(hydroxymethyl)glutathione dehydrogenase/alcohol dehydrogenase